MDGPGWCTRHQPNGCGVENSDALPPGIPLGPGAYHCHNRATDPDALRPTCGKRLGGFGCHALCCAYGPLRNTHHNEMADLVAKMAQEAGATVTRETPIR